MEEIDESSCPTVSPLVKIVPMKHGNSQRLSKFSILHRISKHSDRTCPDQGTKNRSAECRICLEDSLQSCMIKPCKCTGSVQFAHEKCMSQWIKTKVQKGQLIVRCEMCQADFNYDQEQSKVLVCSQIKKNWQRRRKEMCCYLAFYFIGLLFLISFIVFLSIANGDEANLKPKIIPNSTIMLIYIAVILLCLIFLLFMTILFFGEYCTKKQVTVWVRRYAPPKMKLVRRSRNSIIKI